MSTAGRKEDVLLVLTSGNVPDPIGARSKTSLMTNSLSILFECPILVCRMRQFGELGVDADDLKYGLRRVGVQVTYVCRELRIVPHSLDSCFLC